MNLLPTQPFRRSSDEYLIDKFLIVDLSKQNRPVLFFQTHILGPWNQYTPVLLLGHIYQVLGIRTRLFYFFRPIYSVPGISTRLFYFLGHIYQVLRISTRQKGYPLFENDFGLSLMLSCAMVFYANQSAKFRQKKIDPS